VLVALVCGTLVGVWAGPLGRLGGAWRLLGNQGWEFVELGKLWQGLMFAAFVLWTVIIVRAVRPQWRAGDAWIMPKWLLYAVASITVLFLSAFVAARTPTSSSPTSGAGPSCTCGPRRSSRCSRRCCSRGSCT
jgi:nitric oxide reductase subunit B